MIQPLQLGHNSKASVTRMNAYFTLASNYNEALLYEYNNIQVLIVKNLNETL